MADDLPCVPSTPAPLGQLRKIRLWHDSHGASPAWFVSHVMVRELRGGSRGWFFPAECWLAAGRRDGRVERELVCLRGGLGFRKVCGICVPRGRPGHGRTWCLALLLWAVASSQSLALVLSWLT